MKHSLHRYTSCRFKRRVDPVTAQASGKASSSSLPRMKLDSVDCALDDRRSRARSSLSCCRVIGNGAVRCGRLFPAVRTGRYCHNQRPRRPAAMSLSAGRVQRIRKQASARAMGRFAENHNATSQQRGGHRPSSTPDRFKLRLQNEPGQDAKPQIGENP